MNRHVSPQELPTTTEAAAFSAPRPPDFQQAQRHSARVRWIRRLLPLGIVAAVVILGAGSLLARLQVKLDLPFDIGHLTLSGSRLTMELPKLSGFTDDNRGYSVTAKTATQDLTRPDVIDLSDIDARLEMADKGWTTIAAKTGSIDTKTQFIRLDDGVDLAMKGGYGGHLRNAEVDVKAGTIVSREPVTFTYLDGKLVADRLTVSDRGEKALFEGNVQLDFRLSSLQKSAPPRGSRDSHPGATTGSIPDPATNKPAAAPAPGHGAPPTPPSRPVSQP